MKNILTNWKKLATTAVLSSALLFASCEGVDKAKEKIGNVVRTTYVVVVKTNNALDTIEDLVKNTPVADKVTNIIDKVDGALDTVSESLKIVADFLGVDTTVTAGDEDLDDLVAELKRANAELKDTADSAK